MWERAAAYCSCSTHIYRTYRHGVYVHMSKVHTQGGPGRSFSLTLQNCPLHNIVGHTMEAFSFIFRVTVEWIVSWGFHRYFFSQAIILRLLIYTIKYYCTQHIASFANWFLCWQYGVNSEVLLTLCNKGICHKTCMHQLCFIFNFSISWNTSNFLRFDTVA